MTGEFWIYALYPAFAAAFCIILLAKAWKSKAAYEYINLFATLVLINTSQVAIYLVINASFKLASYFADLYLITAYFFFAHLLQLALSMSEHNRGSWPKYIYIIPVALTAMHIAGLSIESYRLESNTILHNDGTYAWCFDVFILAASLTSIITFILNTHSTEYDYVLISRNLIALFSFVPFLLGVAYIVIRSNTDSPVSVVYIIPTMSLWIACVFYYITKPNIIDLTRSPKGHWEAVKLIYSAICHIDNKQQIEEFSKQWQLLTYKEKLRKYKTYTRSAKALGVSESTLRKAVPVEELRKLVQVKE